MFFATVAVVVAGLVGPTLWSRARAPFARVTLERRGEATGPRTPGALRVATYNVAHLRGLPDDNWRPTRAERDARASAIAELLVEIDADVVVLNEVDFDASWSDRIDAASLLAERAGYPLVVKQRNLDVCAVSLCWRFGNAILSRVALDDPRVIDLPNAKRWETWLAGKKRGALVTLKLPGGDVRLAAVHLCHRFEAVRHASARILDAIANEGPPLIVAGDLNAAPAGFPLAERAPDGSRAFTVFDARFSRIPSSPPPDADLTFPSNGPVQLLDWILIPPPLAFSSYRVVSSTLSDHRPVVADLTLPR